MPRKYTDEEKEFIKNICKGKTVYEIIDLFNKRFNSNITAGQIRGFMKNHNLRSNIDRHTLGKIFVPKLVTDEQLKFVKDNAEGLSNNELTQKFNNYFNLNLKVSQIKALKARNHIDSGLTGHYKKGNMPFNKGMKGVCGKGCEETWFKKGNTPKNHRPVGSERINVDGYIEVKIAEPNKWRLKQQLVWEQHKGPIPKGHAVIFGDGNQLNLDINNLILVSRKQLLILNNNKLIKNDADLTRTGVIIADIYSKLSDIKKEM